MANSQQNRTNTDGGKILSSGPESFSTTNNVLCFLMYHTKFQKPSIGTFKNLSWLIGRRTVKQAFKRGVHILFQQIIDTWIYFSVLHTISKKYTETLFWLQQSVPHWPLKSWVIQHHVYLLIFLPMQWSLLALWSFRCQHLAFLKSFIFFEREFKKINI